MPLIPFEAYSQVPGVFFLCKCNFFFFYVNVIFVMQVRDRRPFFWQAIIHILLQLSEVVFICTVNLKETRTLLYTEKICTVGATSTISHTTQKFNDECVTYNHSNSIFFFFNNLSNIQIRILLFIITFIHVLNRRVKGIYFRLKYNTCPNIVPRWII